MKEAVQKTKPLDRTMREPNAVQNKIFVDNRAKALSQFELKKTINSSLQSKTIEFPKCNNPKYMHNDTRHVAQRFINIAGERIEDPTDIDGFIKKIAGHNMDRKIWPQLKTMLLRQFEENRTHDSVGAFFESLSENGGIEENLENSQQENLLKYDDGTYEFESTKFGDMQRNNASRPRSIRRGDDNLYRTNIWDSNASNFALARGTYQFVKVRDKPLTYGKKGHEHLAKSGGGGVHDVEFAGEATFNAGELLFWTNNSGHFKPDARAMNQSGLPIEKFVPLGFVDDDAVNLAARNTKNPRTIADLFGVSVNEIQAAFNRLGIRKRGGGKW